MHSKMSTKDKFTKYIIPCKSIGKYFKKYQLTIVLTSEKNFHFMLHLYFCSIVHKLFPKVFF